MSEIEDRIHTLKKMCNNFENHLNTLAEEYRNITTYMIKYHLEGDSDYNDVLNFITILNFIYDRTIHHIKSIKGGEE
jgi:Mg2+ and Co2+ transporter CorA